MTDPGRSPEVTRVEAAFGQVLGDRTRSFADTRAALDELLRTEHADPAVEVRQVRVAGVTGRLVSAPGTTADAGIFVWFHGGGYMLGSSAGYHAATSALSAATGLPVLAPDYRLAPEAPFPAAIEDAEAVLAAVVAEHGASRTVVGGDSAGAGLALAASMGLRDAQLGLTAGIVLVSPLLDLTASGESIVANADSDPIISGRSVRMIASVYLAGADATDVRASPLLGDVRGLPPVLTLVGENEALLDDGVRLHADAGRLHARSRLSVHSDAFHAWTLFPASLPSARAALAEVGAFVSDLPGHRPDRDHAGSA
ncbi:alpha/beta hydrolase fold domain-containing protein [Nocardia miyunensis]|uniref:alpha/beta hydrolase fold domain-containing protein n=1 Tax=Nocardia miyunensis TaxID=282684 RepID=UPI0008337524|nr:alpha/beta hydrolase fold domain-containing protein [Nocardia miyunensis]